MNMDDIIIVGYKTHSTAQNAAQRILYVSHSLSHTHTLIQFRLLVRFCSHLSEIETVVEYNTQSSTAEPNESGESSL